MAEPWAILSGEYPPVGGGVADYTRRLACALAQAGEEVHVWAPGVGVEDPGVRFHQLPDLGPGGLLRLARGVQGARLLVQYAPHAFGLRGLNLPLCAWLARRRPAPWVMFHEVHFPCAQGGWRGRVLGRTQQVMAALAGRAASRTYVSTEAWTPLLRRLAPRAHPVWLPVPSNLPEAVSPETAARAREALAPGGGALIGHFGTHGTWFAAQVSHALRALLRADPARSAVLLGRGGQPVAARLLADEPSLTGRVHAWAGEPARLATGLAACDVVLQPYLDGPTTRRGTLMAALALGRAVVSNRGDLTEPAFMREPLLRLAPSPEGLADEAERLLADPPAREALGRAAASAYEARFSLACTVETLRREARCGSPS